MTDSRHHQCPLTVRLNEVGPDGCAGVTSIANYLQHAAGEHAGLPGVADGATDRHRFGWVLTRQLIEMTEWPKLGQQIIVETWPSAGSRRLFSREFQIRDAGGTNIGNATSSWAVWDIDARKIAAMPAELAASFKTDPAKPIAFSDRILPELAGISETVTLTARAMDADMNGHVNNAVLFGWVVEPLLLAGRGKLASIDIMFRRECVPGDVILSLAGDEKAGACLHRLIRQSDDAEIARARTVWR